MRFPFPSSQMGGARDVFTWWEIDGAARVSGGVDGGLDSASVRGLAVARSTIAAHVELGGVAGRPQGAQGNGCGEEDTGPAEHSSSRWHRSELLRYDTSGNVARGAREMSSGET